MFNDKKTENIPLETSKKRLIPLKLIAITSICLVVICTIVIAAVFYKQYGSSTNSQNKTVADVKYRTYKTKCYTTAIPIKYKSIENNSNDCIVSVGVAGNCDYKPNSQVKPSSCTVLSIEKELGTYWSLDDYLKRYDSLNMTSLDTRKSPNSDQTIITKSPINNDTTKVKIYNEQTQKVSAVYVIYGSKSKLHNYQGSYEGVTTVRLYGPAKSHSESILDDAYNRLRSFDETLYKPGENFNDPLLVQSDCFTFNISGRYKISKPTITSSKLPISCTSQATTIGYETSEELTLTVTPLKGDDEYGEKISAYQELSGLELITSTTIDGTDGQYYTRKDPGGVNEIYALIQQPELGELGYFAIHLRPSSVNVSSQQLESQIEKIFETWNWR